MVLKKPPTSTSGANGLLSATRVRTSLTNGTSTPAARKPIRPTSLTSNSSIKVANSSNQTSKDENKLTVRSATSRLNGLSSSSNRNGIPSATKSSVATTTTATANKTRPSSGPTNGSFAVPKVSLTANKSSTSKRLLMSAPKTPSTPLNGQTPVSTPLRENQLRVSTLSRQSQNSSSASLTLSSATSCSLSSVKKRPSSVQMPIQKQMEKQKQKLMELEQKVKERDLRLDNQSIALQALGCIIQHMDQNLNAFEMPKLQSQYAQCIEKLNQLNSLTEQLRSELSFEQTEREREKCEAKEEMDRFAIELRCEQQRHQKEREKLLEMFECEAQSTEKLHQTELNELKSQIQALKDDLERERSNAIEQERLLNEAKKRAEVAERNLTADKDRKVRVLGDRNNFLQQEVESLRCVLELREQDLRNSQQKLQMQLVEQDQIQVLQQQLQTLQQQHEQLELALQMKGDALRSAEQELLDLRAKMDEQAKESDHLTRKNEELEFVLNESISQSFGEHSPVLLGRMSLARCWTERPNRTHSLCLTDNSLVNAPKSLQRPLSYAAGDRYSIATDSFADETNGSLERAGRLKRKKCLLKDFEIARISTDQSVEQQQQRLNNHVDKHTQKESRDSISEFLLTNETIDCCDQDNESSIFEHTNASDATLDNTVILINSANKSIDIDSPNHSHDSSDNRNESILNRTFDAGTVSEQDTSSLTAVIRPHLTAQDESGQCYCSNLHHDGCCATIITSVVPINDDNNNPSSNSINKSPHLHSVQNGTQSVLDSGFGDL